MAYTITKSFTIATGSVIINRNEINVSGVSHDLPRNFVDISTTIATTGSYSLYVETAPNTGFKKVIDNSGGDISTIDAALTGSTVADGAALGWSFNGNPHQIKVVATTVVGPTVVDVVVTQNAT